MNDKEKSRDYFNRHSRTVVNRNGYWNVDYRVTCQIIQSRGIKRLLDIGCGNGAFLEKVHKVNNDIHLFGLDYSDGMVKESGLRNPTATVKQGDAENNPYESEMCDGITCNMSIHHYPHPQKAIDEMYRILCNKGTVIINDLTGPKWLIYVMNKMFAYLNTGDHQVYTREEITGMLKQAGFANIRYKKITPFSYICVGRKGKCEE